jgi:hypothetical protein
MNASGTHNNVKFSKYMNHQRRQSMANASKTYASYISPKGEEIPGLPPRRPNLGINKSVNLNNSQVSGSGFFKISDPKDKILTVKESQKIIEDKSVSHLRIKQNGGNNFRSQRLPKVASSSYSENPQKHHIYHKNFLQYVGFAGPDLANSQMKNPLGTGGSLAVGPKYK